VWCLLHEVSNSTLCLLLLQQCEQPKPKKSEMILTIIDGRLLLDLRHYSILRDHWKAITVDRPKLYKHIAPPKITNEFLHWRRSCSEVSLSQ
jgi:hypothetical protein